MKALVCGLEAVWRSDCEPLSQTRPGPIDAVDVAGSKLSGGYMVEVMHKEAPAQVGAAGQCYPYANGSKLHRKRLLVKTQCSGGTVTKTRTSHQRAFQPQSTAMTSGWPVCLQLPLPCTARDCNSRHHHRSLSHLPDHMLPGCSEWNQAELPRSKSSMCVNCWAIWLRQGPGDGHN